MTLSTRNGTSSTWKSWLTSTTCLILTWKDQKTVIHSYGMNMLSFALSMEWKRKQICSCKSTSPWLDSTLRSTSLWEPWIFRMKTMQRHMSTCFQFWRRTGKTSKQTCSWASCTRLLTDLAYQENTLQSQKSREWDSWSSSSRKTMSQRILELSQ